MTSRLVICRCARAGSLDPSEVESLIGMRHDAWVVDDLCALAADRDPRLGEFLAQGQVTVVACFERAVEWLLRAAGYDGELTVANLHADSAATIAERLPAAEAGGIASTTVDESDPDAWPAWFPIIDYGRCSTCHQCADFCLFDVFADDENGRIVVANPHNCKNNCPACARVCPDAAIMFPKLDEAPINGAEPGENDGGQIQIDVAQAMGQDLYETLKARRAGVKTRLLRNDALAKAEAERCACSCTTSGKDAPALCSITMPAKGSGR